MNKKDVIYSVILLLIIISIFGSGFMLGKRYLINNMDIVDMCEIKDREEQKYNFNYSDFSKEDLRDFTTDVYGMYLAQKKYMR